MPISWRAKLKMFEILTRAKILGHDGDKIDKFYRTILGFSKIVLAPKVDKFRKHFQFCSVFSFLERYVS